MPNKNSIRTDLGNGTIIERTVTPFSHFYDYEIKSPLLKKRFNAAKTTEEKNKLLQHFITSSSFRGEPAIVIKDKEGNIVDGTKALDNYMKIAKSQYRDYAYKSETLKQILNSNAYTPEEKQAYLNSLSNIEYVLDENGNLEPEFKTVTLPSLEVNAKLPKAAIDKGIKPWKDNAELQKKDREYDELILGQSPEVLANPDKLKDIHYSLSDIITNPYYAKNYSEQELADMADIISLTGLSHPKQSLANKMANNDGIFVTEKYLNRADELGQDRSSLADKFDSALNKADMYAALGQAAGTTLGLTAGAIPEPTISKAIAAGGGALALASSIASMGIDGMQAIRGLTQNDYNKTGINSAELAMNAIPYGKMSSRLMKGINTAATGLSTGLSQYDVERSDLLAKTSAYNRYADINKVLNDTQKERLGNAVLTGTIGGALQGTGYLYTGLKNAAMPFVNNTILPRINRFSEGGLVEYNEGGTHDENPNGGVPIGIGENGKPNTVEEGETRYGDYIFSNRLHPLMGELSKVGLQKYEPKKSNKKDKPTYADYSKKINKEFEETPNDPISKRGQENLLGRLQQAQEMTKKQQEEMRQIALQNKINKENERRYQQALMMQQAEPSIEQQLGLEEMPMPEMVPELAEQTQFGNGGKVSSRESKLDSIINQYKDAAAALQNPNLGENLSNILPENDSRMWSLLSVPAAYYGLGTASRLATQALSNDTFNKLRRKDLASYNKYGDIDMNPLSLFRDKEGNFSADATKSKLARGLRRATVTSNHLPETWNAITGGFNNLRGAFNYGPNKDITKAGLAKKTVKGIVNVGKPIGAAYGARLLWDLFSPTKDDTEAPIFLTQDRTGASAKGYTRFKDGGLVNPQETNNFAKESYSYKKPNYIDLLIKPSFNLDYIKGIEGVPQSKEQHTQSLREEEQNKYRKFDEKLGYLSYVPAAINGMSVLTDLAGLTNKSNYEYADRIGQLGNHPGIPTPRLNTRVAYTPLDINYSTNKIINQGLGNREALISSYSGNRSALQAGLLSSNLATQNAIGNLARQAYESNLQQRLQVANMNNAIDAQNAQMQMQADQINLGNKYNRDKYLSSSIAARMKEDMLTSQARNSNISNLSNSLYNLGMEARRRNALRGMFPNVSVDELGRILEHSGLLIK